jgi:hypothetical protein
MYVVGHRATRSLASFQPPQRLSLTNADHNDAVEAQRGIDASTKVTVVDHASTVFLTVLHNGSDPLYRMSQPQAIYPYNETSISIYTAISLDISMTSQYV